MATEIECLVQEHNGVSFQSLNVLDVFLYEEQLYIKTAEYVATSLDQRKKRISVNLTSLVIPYKAKILVYGAEVLLK